jgi:hypothetical protein
MEFCCQSKGVYILAVWNQPLRSNTSICGDKLNGRMALVPRVGGPHMRARLARSFNYWLLVFLDSVPLRCSQQWIRIPITFTNDSKTTYPRTQLPFTCSILPTCKDVPIPWINQCCTNVYELRHIGLINK